MKTREGEKKKKETKIKQSGATGETEHKPLEEGEEKKSTTAADEKK